MSIDNLALLISLAAYVTVIWCFVGGTPKKTKATEKKTKF